jgi:hypothetical protein
MLSLESPESAISDGIESRALAGVPWRDVHNWIKDEFGQMADARLLAWAREEWNRLAALIPRDGD